MEGNDRWKRITITECEGTKKDFISLLILYETTYKTIIIAFVFLLSNNRWRYSGPILIKIFIDDYLTPKNFDFQTAYYHLHCSIYVIQITKCCCHVFSVS